MVAPWGNAFNKRRNVRQVVRIKEKKKDLRSNPVNSEVREEVGGGGASCTGADIPMQPVERTALKQISALQLVEDLTA